MGLLAETRTSDSGLGAEGHWSIPGTAAYYKARGITPPTPSGGVNVVDVQSPFKQAIAALTASTGDVEKMYQSGKRRILSDMAMQAVNAGMANTLNMPAASVAYDEANRPATNVALAGQKAGLLSSMGQTMAGVYGTDVGARTSTANARLGADTSFTNTAMSLQADRERMKQELQAQGNRNALQQYLGELELKYKYGGQGATARPTNIATTPSKLYG